MAIYSCLSFLNVNYILSLQIDDKLLVKCGSSLFLPHFFLIFIFIFLALPSMVAHTFQWPKDHLGSWFHIFNEMVHRPRRESHRPTLPMWHAGFYSGMCILTDILDL